MQDALNEVRRLPGEQDMRTLIARHNDTIGGIIR